MTPKPSKTTQWAERRAAKGKLAPVAWSSLRLADSRPPACGPVVNTPLGICFLASYDTVRIVSLEDGTTLSTLSAGWEDNNNSATEGTIDTSDRRIVGILINPNNPLQLLVAHHRPGVIRVWNYLKPKLLRTIILPSPAQKISANEKYPRYIFATLRKTPKAAASSKSWTSSPDSLLFRISLDMDTSSASSSSGLPTKPQSLDRLAKTRQSLSLFCSPTLPYIYLLTRAKLHIYPIDALSENNSPTTPTPKPRSIALRAPSQSKMTCLAVHPLKNMIATGDESGKIRFWHSLDPSLLFAETAGVENNEAIELTSSATSMVHWHSDAVGDIAFTHNGAYLLSGGQEGVLVLHHLDSGHLEFIPRLGFAIVSITADENIWSIGLADGTTMLIDPQTLAPMHTLASIKTEPRNITISSSNRSLPLSIDPLTQALVLSASHPSSLQFYSLSSSTHLGEIQVSSANSNRITKTASRKVIPVTVDHVVFSPRSLLSNNQHQQTAQEGSASWMVTADSWVANNVSPQCHVKFWTRSNPTENFKLLARVDNPHKGPVSSMFFNPNPKYPYVITTGRNDDVIKIWRIKTTSSLSIKSSKRSKPTENKAKREICDLLGILSWRRQIPRKATFSPDGSLIAVAYSNVVVLWDSETFELVEIITVQTDVVGELEHVLFVNVEPPQFTAAKNVQTTINSTSQSPSLCLIAGGPGGIVAWDVATARELFTFPVLLRQLFTHESQQQSQSAYETHGGGYFIATEYRAERRIPSNFIFVFRIDPLNPHVPDVRVGELPVGIRHIAWYSTAPRQLAEKNNDVENSDPSLWSRIRLVVRTVSGDVLLVSATRSNLENAIQSTTSDLGELQLSKNLTADSKKKSNKGRITESGGLFRLYAPSTSKTATTTTLAEGDSNGTETGTAALNQQNYMDSTSGIDTNVNGTWIEDQRKMANLPNVFNAPSHLLPSMVSICNDVLVRPFLSRTEEEETKQRTGKNDNEWLQFIPRDLTEQFRSAVDGEDDVDYLDSMNDKRNGDHDDDGETTLWKNANYSNSDINTTDKYKNDIETAFENVSLEDGDLVKIFKSVDRAHSVQQQQDGDIKKIQKSPSSKKSSVPNGTPDRRHSKGVEGGGASTKKTRV